MSEVIVGGDLKLSAQNLRDEAERLEAMGDEAGADRHREAAWHLDEAGAWLAGERRGAAPGDIEATPPMTLERASRILDAHDAYPEEWVDRGAAVSGDEPPPASRYRPEFIVVAVAEKILRELSALETSDAA